ncbi:MAG: polysaccharide biosynthesis C-terminal domain-containing protein [Oscillospiraceae bacterium]|nr:polysaccharide biosynthesis C-terminal domain-containing protein [Oscillospiraceae bacterium]
MNEKHSRLLKDTVIFAVGSLGSKLILFFLVPLYTNYMTQAEYGVADLVYTASELVVPFVSLVIFDAMLRFGLSREHRPEDVLLVSLQVLAVGSLVTIALTPLLGLYPRLGPWKWYLSATVILFMLSHTEMNYLKVTDRNKTYALISILQTLVLALTNLALLVGFRLGIRGYLIASLAGSATAVVLATFCGHIPSALRRAKPNRELRRQMLLFSIPLILNNVSWWVIQSSDKFMVDFLVGAAALGLYTAATKIPSLINVIIGIFSQAWNISAVREIEGNNELDFYGDVLRTYSVVAIGAALLVCAISKPFMLIYTGREFHSAWQYVPLLLASAAFSAIADYYASLYRALKRSVRNSTSAMMAALVNIAVNFALIPRLGVWGAVIGTVVAYAGLTLFRIVDVYRFLPFDPRWGLFLANSLLMLVQAVLVSLDWHAAAVSLVCLVLFVCVNRSVLRDILTGLKRFLRR